VGESGKNLGVSFAHSGLLGLNLFQVLEHDRFDGFGQDSNLLAVKCSVKGFACEPT
jgi:hypothetical protein